MHELSICQSLVDSIISELGKLDGGPVRLLSARVVVGEMRQVVPEYIEQAYVILVKGTAAEGSRLEIRNVPVTARCGACGWQGGLEKNWFFCPACESNRVEVTGGMELYLDNLEVETGD